MRRTLLLLASVTALSMPAVAVHAQAAPIALRAASDPYAELIAEAAQRFAIPAAWIRAIMRIESRGDRLVVVCGDGHLLRILQIQPEGRRPMSAREFLAGRPLPTGTRFTRPSA